MRGRGDRPGWLDQLARPRDGRLLAGVCAGVSRGLVLNVTLVRLCFVLLGLASGIGVLLYLTGWLVLPREQAAGRHGSFLELLRENLAGVGDDLRQAASSVRDGWTRVEDGEDRGWPRPLNRRWIAIGLISFGAFVFLYSLGVFAWLGPGRTLGLVIVAVGLAVLFSGAPDLRRR